MAAAIIIWRVVAPDRPVQHYMATPRASRPTNRQHRRSAQGGEAPAPARRLRLHRRRRRSRDHARSKLPGIQRGVVPAALRGREREVQPRAPRCSGRQSRCRSSSRRSAARACSTRAAKRSRRAPPVRPARSTSCRRSPAACSRTCDARRPGRPGISSISSAAATWRCASIAARAQGGLLGAGRHHRYAGRRAPRARPAQRHEGAGHAESAEDAPLRLAVRRAGRAGSPGFFRDGGLMSFPNVVLPGEGPMPYADVGSALESSTVTWPDLRWIRDAWEGPIVVKGVHRGDDARQAIDVGADAVVVSNHGGRQLDSVHGDAARAARGRRRGERPGGGPARRRHPPRQRCREGTLPRRARGADWPRVRLWTGRCRGSRCRARDRDPAG